MVPCSVWSARYPAKDLRSLRRPNPESKRRWLEWPAGGTTLQHVITSSKCASIGEDLVNIYFVCIMPRRRKHATFPTSFSLKDRMTLFGPSRPDDRTKPRPPTHNNPPERGLGVRPRVKWGGKMSLVSSRAPEWRTPADLAVEATLERWDDMSRRSVGPKRTPCPGFGDSHGFTHR